MIQGCSGSFEMGEITTFQSLQNENPSKIDEIRPDRPKNDLFFLTGTPHLRKKTAEHMQAVGAVISIKTRSV